MTGNNFNNFHCPLVAENIIFLDEIGSTNDYAKDLIRGGKRAGTVVIAARQTAGRGRLGRSWDGGVDNIYMSVIISPQKSAGNNPAHLTLMAGVCVCNVLNKLLKATKYEALIKWPNDIVVDRKKVCGILTEGVALEAMHGVIGIGVNVNRSSFPSELEDKATSLHMLTGLHYDMAEIIKMLLIELSAYYERFESDGINSFIAEYKALCLNIGKDVTIHENGEIYEALCLDIATDGGLYVHMLNGERRTLSSGEVSVRGIYESDL